MATEERVQPVAEERVEERSTPKKDLVSAFVIGLLSILAIVFSLRLDMPGLFYTAPGLLPFVTGCTLLLMAIMLGQQAIRAGAVVNLSGLLDDLTIVARQLWSVEQDRRRLLLMVIITFYVLLIAFINFNFRFPTPLDFDFEISSYEVISVFIVTWILRLFWQASVRRCFVVTLTTVLMLTSIFRYGFGILMPETF